MNVEERQKAFYEFSEEQSKILLGKGHDYTAGRSEEDAYANFRVIAHLLEGAPITSYTVAMIYFLKHVFSLITYAKCGRQESGEALHGRHLDIANYAFILDQLKDEHHQGFAPVNHPLVNKVSDYLDRMDNMKPHKDGPVFCKNPRDPFDRPIKKKPVLCPGGLDCNCGKKEEEPFP